MTLQDTSGSSLNAAADTAPRFHHIAIQTNDLDNSVSWYEAFLGCRQAWSLSEFSELTRSRLPGIRRLSELVLGRERLHLMERDGRPATGPGESVVQFQHLCLSVGAADDLVALRQRWMELFGSGRYQFALHERPTEVVVDSDGVQSFYAYDPNGLELEFTYIPPVTAHDR
jgi:catechol 2,3-dioxygenase-like lactoylglutathione lyase family enzyme